MTNLPEAPPGVTIQGRPSPTRTYDLEVRVLLDDEATAIFKCLPGTTSGPRVIHSQATVQNFLRWTLHHVGPAPGHMMTAVLDHPDALEEMYAQIIRAVNALYEVAQKRARIDASADATGWTTLVP